MYLAVTFVLCWCCLQSADVVLGFLISRDQGLATTYTQISAGRRKQKQGSESVADYGRSGFQTFRNNFRRSNFPIYPKNPKIFENSKRVQFQRFQGKAYSGVTKPVNSMVSKREILSTHSSSFLAKNQKSGPWRNIPIPRAVASKRPLLQSAPLFLNKKINVKSIPNLEEPFVVDTNGGSLITAIRRHFQNLYNGKLGTTDDILTTSTVTTTMDDPFQMVEDTTTDNPTDFYHAIEYVTLTKTNTFETVTEVDAEAKFIENDHINSQNHRELDATVSTAVSNDFSASTNYIPRTQMASEDGINSVPPLNKVNFQSYRELDATVSTTALNDVTTPTDFIPQTQVTSKKGIDSVPLNKFHSHNYKGFGMTVSTTPPNDVTASTDYILQTQMTSANEVDSVQPLNKVNLQNFKGHDDTFSTIDSDDITKSTVFIPQPEITSEGDIDSVPLHKVTFQNFRGFDATVSTTASNDVTTSTYRIPQSQIPSEDRIDSVPLNSSTKLQVLTSTEIILKVQANNENNPLIFKNLPELTIPIDDTLLKTSSEYKLLSILATPSTTIPYELSNSTQAVFISSTSTEPITENSLTPTATTLNEPLTELQSSIFNFNNSTFPKVENYARDFNVATQLPLETDIPIPVQTTSIGPMYDQKRNSRNAELDQTFDSDNANKMLMTVYITEKDSQETLTSVELTPIVPNPIKSDENSESGSFLQCFRTGSLCSRKPDSFALCFLDCVTKIIDRDRKNLSVASTNYNSIIYTLAEAVNSFCKKLKEDFQGSQMLNLKKTLNFTQAVGVRHVSKLANALPNFLFQNAVGPYYDQFDRLKELFINGFASDFTKGKMKSSKCLAANNDNAKVIETFTKTVLQNEVLLDIMLPGYMVWKTNPTNGFLGRHFQGTRNAMESISGFKCGLIKYARTGHQLACPKHNVNAKKSSFCKLDIKYKYVYVFRNGTVPKDQNLYTSMRHSVEPKTQPSFRRIWE